MRLSAEWCSPGSDLESTRPRPQRTVTPLGTTFVNADDEIVEQAAVDSPDHQFLIGRVVELALAAVQRITRCDNANASVIGDLGVGTTVRKQGQRLAFDLGQVVHHGG